MECAKCKQGIKLMKVQNDGKYYHVGCFTCEACKGSLKNRKVHDISGALFHLDCFNQVKENICAKCNKLITGVAMDIGDKTYHEECFACKMCQKSIAGKKYFFEGGEFYDETCYKSLHSLICNICLYEIDGTDVKYVTYFEKFIHHECFTCSVCHKQLSTAEKFRDVKTTVKGALICMPCSMKAPTRRTTLLKFGNFA